MMAGNESKVNELLGGFHYTKIFQSTHIPYKIVCKCDILYSRDTKELNSSIEFRCT